MDNWIKEADRLDKLLHSGGVPADIRVMIVANYADSLAWADKELRRSAAALKNAEEGQQLCSNGAITPTST